MTREVSECAARRKRLGTDLLNAMRSEGRGVGRVLMLQRVARRQPPQIARPTH